jgi:hypothetical protein
MTMLDAVYVDTVEEKAIVALKPKAAFQALFQIATTREGSGVVIINEIRPAYLEAPDESTLCSWWRVDLLLTPYLRVLVAANWAGLAYRTPANYPVSVTK